MKTIASFETANRKLLSLLQQSLMSIRPTPPHFHMSWDGPDLHGVHDLVHGKRPNSDRAICRPCDDEAAIGCDLEAGD